MVSRVPGSLNTSQRRRALERLSARPEVDVLVIGGGITGVGVALDAVTRGLRVVLVERGDLAQGTSQWSSKLIHGGLRYLRQGEVSLAWESARERRRLMRDVAPHFVRPLAFVAPLNDELPPFGGMLTSLGVWAGDALRRLAGSPSDLLPRPRRISPSSAMERLSCLSRRHLRGAVLFWDGQLVDDVRLVVAVARTAALHGADVITRCVAEAVDGGLVALRDQLTGDRMEIRASHVVNATGVWAASLEPRLRITPSKGVHLVVRTETVDSPNAALIVPVNGETARWVGLTPMGDDRVLIGVTDERYDGPLDDHVAVTAREEQFLLSTLATALARPLTSGDVIGRFAGLRPLIAASHDEPSGNASRQHVILGDRRQRLLTVCGGKLTTYRSMAEQCVDRIMIERGGGAGCRTARLPLVGAAARTTLSQVAAPERLVRRYGVEASALMECGVDHPELRQPIAPGLPYLGVELFFGIQHEGAMSVDDLIDRRIRAGLVPAERQQSYAAAAALVEKWGDRAVAPSSNG